MSQVTFSLTELNSDETLPTTEDGMAIVLVEKLEELSGAAASIDGASEGKLSAALAAGKFKPGWGSKFSIFALEGSPAPRLTVVAADLEKSSDADPWLFLGGHISSALGKETEVHLFLGDLEAEHAAQLLSGIKLGSYKFDRYKSQPEKSSGDDEASDEDTPPQSISVSVYTSNLDALTAAWSEAEAVVAGVILARDLVNEPPTVLGPVEFAGVAEALSDLGVDVTVLDEPAMTELGMNALLGVAQGSEKPARLAIMQWKGGPDDAKPVAIVGKGVVFDTGGISIKPAGGMEDMKGDMGGAACVVGLMHALAARSAAVNAVGVIGLVENMPDGKAQRPGDIVTSMAGKTIEIINTDAEGRLVLADALHYTRTEFEPVAMIDLATLTGAILVALGQDHAGMFSNNDDLAEQLHQAGQDTGEKVWRMPLGKAYNKMIDSRFADMKNTGGRFAGSITAAEFLQRFVGDTPWAHLDVAGTAMSAPKSPINSSFGSGFGVRLLNHYIKTVYENAE
ncbi:MAG: leucyl aminopeptidase [Pseudomonadota bacterium]